MRPLLFAQLFLVLLALSGCASSSSSSGSASGEDAAALLSEGLQAYQSRNYDLAKDKLTAVTTRKATRNQQITAFKHLAFIHAIQQNPREAKRQFLKAFYLDKDFVLDRAELGNPYWMPAFMSASKQFAFAQSSGSELYQNGKTAYEKRRYDDAINYLETAVEKKDLDTGLKVDAYKLLAFIHAVNKQPAEAKADFRRAFQLNKYFELDKSEYGNPVWTKLFDEVKTEFRSK
jgi:outer membrane protein assembly factor BamD (BamD/ComL family)